MIKALIAYFILINLIGAVINIIDKRRARNNQWRVKESTLWTVALLGGAPLSYAAMKAVRHKTKHTSFMVGMPILALLDTAVFLYAILKLTGRL